MSTIGTRANPFDRMSPDGRWGMSGPDDHGYCHLFFCSPAGLFEPEDFGLLSDPDNFEVSVDNAEEELRCLVADAVAEFRL